ncbi:hypothetical protein [Nocardia sp. NPDC049707]|uniref:hypothetical protein n=1 Tax=Nocardia sp. NPDC049707 TaxID=3154735 RepID=UPI003417A823
MAFEPIRMTAPDGRTCLVGSATEREHLLAHGYRITPAEPEPEPKPAPAPVPVVTEDDKPAASAVKKPTK